MCYLSWSSYKNVDNLNLLSPFNANLSLIEVQFMILVKILKLNHVLKLIKIEKLMRLGI